MEQSEKVALINRLKSVAGHVNGIVTMVEEDRYCVDLIKQIQAAQAALAKANQIILDNHLRTCLRIDFQRASVTRRREHSYCRWRSISSRMFCACDSRRMPRSRMTRAQHSTTGTMISSTANDSGAGVLKPLVMRWNGTTWTQQTVGGVANGRLTAVSCASISDCNAVGTYTNSQYVQVPLG